MRPRRFHASDGAMSQAGLAEKSAKENPGARPGFFEIRLGGRQDDPAFFPSNPFRLSKSSIFTPWRFMMMPCWMIESRLFQAQ